MEETKTGAIVCRMPDAENGMVYRAVVYIKNIPHTVSDEELKSKISLKMLPVDLAPCEEIFFRADIHSTSNEVQEQFEQLHPGDSPIPEISFNGTIFSK
jgi:hypothetical protein